MATDHVRVYFVADAAATRTDEQWSLLAQGARDKPMAAAILDAARRQNMPHNFLNFNRLSVRDVNDKYRYRLGDFEIDKSQVDDLLKVLNARAAASGVVGSNQAKFAGVMLKELQEVAVEADYPTLAPLLGLEIIGFGPRDTAIAAAQAWVLAHSTDWEDTTLASPTGQGGKT